MAKLVEVDEIPSEGKTYKLVPVDDVPTAPSKGFGAQLSDAIGQIPRQTGLAARYGLEGVGNVADFMATPIRAGMNMIAGPENLQTRDLITGNTQRQDKFRPGFFSYLSDQMGLPKPETAQERVVGDATRMLAGAAVPLGLAQRVASGTSGTTQAVANMMAANRPSQLISAAASGGAGGYARETGGDASAQFLASLAAGVGAPAMVNLGANGIRSLVNRYSAQAPNIANVEVTINNALKDSGMTLADIPANVRNTIRSDVSKAMEISGDLSPDAIRRLADYRMTGATPTRAGLTLDPAIVTQQKNLAKLGINSKDIAGQRLGQIENANNTQLVNNLNDLGARAGIDSEMAGGRLSAQLADVGTRNKADISKLYSAARDSTGREANLDPSHFTQNLGNKLNEANLEAFLPGEIRTMVNNFATGKTPLNVNTSEQFKTIVGNAQRASNDGNVRTALGMVRGAIDETPLLQGAGKQAQEAFGMARDANRRFMNQVEQTPALEAAMNGVPDKGFFQKYVIAADSKQFKNTLNALDNTPEAMQMIKDQTLAHLKEKALSGAADEVGKFSQSRFNGALKMLGENKLKMIFSPDELAQLKAVGRVASYEQFQPVGAAINNSNTASAGMAAVLDRIGNSPFLSKIPMGRMLAEPVQNISMGMQSKTALNAPKGLLQLNAPQQPEAARGLLLSPAFFAGLSQQ